MKTYHGGCKGTKNNFKTKEACEAICSTMPINTKWRARGVSRAGGFVKNLIKGAGKLG